MTGIDGWCFRCVFENSLNKIAAELLWQNSWKVWTEMLGSKMKQFFLKGDMPMLGLFNYRKFLFQRLKVLIARIFQVVKPFRFTNVGSVRNFIRVISRNSAKVQNYSNCLFFFLWEKKSQVLSEFKDVNLVVLLSVCKTYW